MVPDAKKIKLKIDYREKRSGIIEELEKIPGLFNCEITRLPIGDYQIGDKIIIERKTIPDFLASVKSGRIFRQAYRMANTSYCCLLILEGKKPEPKITKMKRAAIQGVLLHLVVSLNISTIRSRDIRETTWLIKQIARQYQLVQSPWKKNVVYRNPGIIISKKQRQKLNLLQNIPGIGIKKALALLRSLGSIEKILNSEATRLAEVSEIGQKLANNIYSIIHSPF